MPIVDFESLPDDARLWAFGTTRSLDERQQQRLLERVDEHLARWSAHGEPLTCARDWLHGRFLAIAVDQRDAHASGCSIDGLYGVLREVERELGVGLLGGGTVYFRDASGEVAGVPRSEFIVAAERGEVGRETPVFDLTVATAGQWRRSFEKPAAGSWHGQMLPAEVVR